MTIRKKVALVSCSGVRGVLVVLIDAPLPVLFPGRKVMVVPPPMQAHEAFFGGQDCGTVRLWPETGVNSPPEEECT
jgi:hypothetical protein